MKANNLKLVNVEDFVNFDGHWYITLNLQPYTEQKEESMEEPKELLIGFTKDNNGDWILNTHKDYEIKEFDGKFKLVKKQLQCLKTYEECCEVLHPNSSKMCKVLTSGHNCELLKKFGELLICRDAYWKIAGDWKPNYDDDEQDKWGILKLDSNGYQYGESTSFVFPTAEMRDTFYENFKDLIETCKELL